MSNVSDNKGNQWLDRGERAIRAVGVGASLAVLGWAMWRGIWRGLRRPGGRSSGAARHVLRPGRLLIVGALWIGFCALLWRPLPLRLSPAARLAALLGGAIAWFSGLALYVAGMLALGPQFRPSSSLGVELAAGQSLVTHGPFAWVRHPMYLAAQAVSLGGLLLYRNWTFAFVVPNFLGLFVRARREEEVLAAEFGAEWDDYARRVPFWLPRRPVGRVGNPPLQPTTADASSPSD